MAKPKLLEDIQEQREKLAAHEIEYADFKGVTESSIDVLQHTRTIRSNKDAEGIFTTVEYRRTSNDTLAGRTVLSGGTSPLYTNRTITRYAADGVTVENEIVTTLTYDVDGDLVSEV